MLPARMGTKAVKMARVRVGEMELGQVAAGPGGVAVRAAEAMRRTK